MKQHPHSENSRADVWVTTLGHVALAVAVLLTSCTPSFRQRVDGPLEGLVLAEAYCRDHVPRSEQSDCLRRVGDAAFELKHFEEARRIYEATGLSRTSPRLKFAIYQLALDAVRRGNAKVAANYLTQIGYSARDVQIELGDLAYERGDVNGAIHYYQSNGVKGRQPRLHNALYRLASERTSRADWDGADSALTRAGVSAQDAARLIARSILGSKRVTKFFGVAMRYVEMGGLTEQQAKLRVGRVLLPSAIEQNDVEAERAAVRLLSSAGVDGADAQRQLRARLGYERIAAAQESAKRCKPLVDSWRAASCDEGIMCMNFTMFGANGAPNWSSSNCLTNAKDAQALEVRFCVDSVVSKLEAGRAAFAIDGLRPLAEDLAQPEALWRRVQEEIDSFKCPTKGRK